MVAAEDPAADGVVVGAAIFLLCAATLVLAGPTDELDFGFVVALDTIELAIVDAVVVSGPASTDASESGQAVTAA